MSGIGSLKEVAVGLGLAVWVEEGLIYAIVGSRAHDLRVHFQHTGLVSNSTLHFCIRARVWPVTGFAFWMSGPVADADWEGAGQRRPHAFVAEQKETMRVASRTRK